MNWSLVIEFNRTALLRLLAELFAMAGMTAEKSVDVLPRRLRAAIFLVLRPAESATRRLAMFSARGLEVVLGAPRPAPVGLVKRRAATKSAPCFVLVDPRKRFGRTGRRFAPGPGPRIFFFDGTDPAFVEAPVPSPDDLLDAGRLCRRLLALRAALEDLPKQAKRLARRQARQKQTPERVVKSPLRPGWPPGYRKKMRHAVDEILRDCHTLATLPPDTS